MLKICYQPIWHPTLIENFVNFEIPFLFNFLKIFVLMLFFGELNLFFGILKIFSIIYILYIGIKITVSRNRIYYRYYNIEIKNSTVNVKNCTILNIFTRNMSKMLRFLTKFLEICVFDFQIFIEISPKNGLSFIIHFL